jgi:hypothetical protein
VLFVLLLAANGKIEIDGRKFLRYLPGTSTLFASDESTGLSFLGV